MSRPAPRKSSLAGSSPVTPPAQTTPPQRPATAAPAERTPAKQPATGQKKYAHKVSFYQDPEDTDRVRGAILYTMVSEGNRNLSQFVHRAVMAEVERLEAKYNGGQPFPAVGAREIPQGGAAAAAQG